MVCLTRKSKNYIWKGRAESSLSQPLAPSCMLSLSPAHSCRPCNRAISTVIVPRSTGPACPVLLGSPGYPQLPPGRHLTVQGHLKHSTIVLLSWSFQPHQTASSPIRYSGQNPTCRPWFFTSRPLTSKPSVSSVDSVPKQFLNLPPSLHLHSSRWHLSPALFHLPRQLSPCAYSSCQHSVLQE